MKIDVQIDVSRLVSECRLSEKQVAYAAVNAINTTALLIQQAEVAHARQVFVIRKAAFMLGTADRPGGIVAKLKPRASVGQQRPYAELWVGGNLDADKGGQVFMRKFEQGGTRPLGRLAKQTVAIPLQGRPARPSFAGPVPYAFTFAGLHLAEYRNGRRLKRNTRSRKGLDVTSNIGEFGVTVVPAAGGASDHRNWKGRNRTFEVLHTKNAPLGGVFQRIGPKRGDIRMIYAFKRDVQLDARLQFVATAQRVATQTFAKELDREVRASIAFNQARA